MKEQNIEPEKWLKAKLAKFVCEEVNGDSILQLDSIRIKDADKWQHKSSFTADSVIYNNSAESEDNTIKVEKKVTITWHQNKRYQKIFGKYFKENLESMRNSIAPKNNRD